MEEEGEYPDVSEVKFVDKPTYRVRDRFKKARFVPFVEVPVGDGHIMTMDEYKAMVEEKKRKGTLFRASKSATEDYKPLTTKQIIKINTKTQPVNKQGYGVVEDIYKDQLQQTTVMDHRVFRHMLTHVDKDLLSELVEFFVLDRDAPAEAKLKRQEMLQEFVRAENPETHVPFSIPRENAKDWVLRTNGSLFEVVKESRGKTSVLVSGSGVDVLSWLSNYAPKTFKSIKSMASEMLEHDKQMEELDEGIGDMLTESRKYRNMNKALDKFSKHSQLDFTEQDSDMVMFGIAPDEFEPDVIIGELITNLRCFYPNAIQLPYLSGRTSEYKFKDQCIAASVILGDSVGAVGNDKRLLGRLVELAADNVVRVKITLEPNELVKGFVVSKGRPHNRVAVIQLDEEDGKPLGDIYEEYYGSIYQANVERNRRYALLKVPEVKPSNANYHQFSQCIKKKATVFFKEHPKSLFKKRVRYLEQTGKSLRRSEMYDFYCMDPGFKKVGGYYKLSADFYYEGALRRLDLGVGTPLFSFESLYRWAQDHPWLELFFDENEGWSTRKQIKVLKR